MALTAFQRSVVRTISQNRRDSGETYVAGGSALNDALGAARLSHDIDLFSDIPEAVHWSLDADSAALRDAGYQLIVEIDRPTFVEAVVSVGEDHTRLQWVQDSAFRFFPLVDHPDFGLTMHPFDLATNKVLALVGRAEPRDWVDTIECNSRLQPLGYLAWAASGKDPGLNPHFILDEACRSARYTEVELAELSFDGERPTAAFLAIEWKHALLSARSIVATLPASRAGECVLDRNGNLVRISGTALAEAIRLGDIRYHAGSLRGAFPVLA